MGYLKEFIEVTSIYDGRKSLIRASCIDAVHDYGEEKVDFGVKPSHREVVFNGCGLDVVESLDEISEMIYGAEL